MIADKLNKLLKNNNMTAYRLARITGISDAINWKVLQREIRTDVSELSENCGGSRCGSK